LGGADLDVLKHAKSERSAFVGLGLVMLGTASVAALSMAFALHNAVLTVIDPLTGGPAKDQPTSHLVLSVFLGVVWGALILVLDRALIKTMQGVAGAAKAVVYAVPRFILAIIIGIVVSTPITLQVFSNEIAVQVKQNQDNLVDQMTRDAADSDTAKKLTSVQKDIAEREKILKGQVDGLSSPDLETAKSNYETAVKAREAAEKARDDAYLVMICEKAGAGSNPQCQGKASNQRGEGDLYQARLQEYNNAQSALSAKQREEEGAQTALTNAQTAANNANKDEVARQQAQANIDLCGKAKDAEDKEIVPPIADPGCQSGLRHEAEVLQQTLAAMENGNLARQQAGLLAQIVALGEISTSKPAAGTAHFFVALLFMAIELLPVIIKTFIAARGVTQYDRIAKKLQDDEFESVTTDTEERQEQRERETKKIKEIRDDMLDREIKLGKTANEHVASEMETILTHALADWSQKVQDVLTANPVTPGQNQPTIPPAGDSYGLPNGSGI
jgi:uncharacterized UPF0146 family protein